MTVGHPRRDTQGEHSRMPSQILEITSTSGKTEHLVPGKTEHLVPHLVTDSRQKLTHMHRTESKDVHCHTINCGETNKEKK